MKKYFLIILFPLIFASCLQSPEERSIENITPVPEKNWVTANAAGMSIIRSIANSATRYVAVGDEGRIATSTNGKIGWTIVNGIPSSNNLRSVIWDGSRFVAVGYSSLNEKGVIAVSSDENGQSWNMIEVPPLVLSLSMGTLTIDPKLFSIAFGNGRYVVVGERGYSAWSEDAVNWNPVWIAPFSQYGFQVNNQNANTVVFGGGMFVTGGTMGVLAFSTNRGEHWEWAANALLGGAFDHINTIAYGAGTFVAAGSRGKLKTLNINQSSITPADNWVSQNSGFSYDINAVTFGGGLFLAAGNAGRIALSGDGIRWNTVPQKGWTSNDNFYSAFYSTHFISGGSGKIIFSND